jgi:hypothetical protein
MAAARTAVRGLSTDELQAIRDALAGGRKPKVVFTDAAGQVAGQTGQVVGLTDPAQSDEWVVVRFGRDELPFSPADLRMAPRGPARRAETKPEPAPEPVAPPAPPFVLDKVPTPRVEAPVRSPAAAPVAPAEPVAAKQPAVAAEQPAAKPARKSARPARPKGPASLTVTLAYADGEWTVAANQGSRALAKPYLIKPAEALKMVALVDVPGVREAVEQIMAVERADAEQQAERLRAELAEIETRLAELRDAG